MRVFSNHSSEIRLRSIIKSISYRFLGTLATTVIAWLITRQISLSISVGISDFIVKVILFYAHERFWNEVAWGKEELRSNFIEKEFF